MTDEQKFYIWSNEKLAFWRPARSGYTFNITEAGKYDFEEAVQICKDANDRFFEKDNCAAPNETILAVV